MRTSSSKKVISPGSEVTVCFKHPDGMGHWPAIWMLPQGFVEGQKQWPRDGENDLVEHMKNHQPYETQSTIHFGSNGQSRNIWNIESVPADVNFFDKLAFLGFILMFLASADICFIASALPCS